MAKSTKGTKQQRPLGKVILYTIIGAIVLGVGSFVAYSVMQYQASEEKAEGFFACNATNTACELSQHIHADIDLTVCGERVVFQKEKGNTNLQHTHKETNKIHWHARLKVDPTTRQPLDSSPIQLGSFFEQMDYSLPKTCSQNSFPQLVGTVNEKHVENILQYVWTDGDKIVILYK